MGRRKKQPLCFASQDSMMDLAQMQEAIFMRKREKCLAMHPYSVWQGKNGFWYTYMPKDEGGRLLKKRNTKKEIEEIIIEYWDSGDYLKFTDVLDDWLDYKLEYGEIYKQTYDKYRSDAIRFFEDTDIDAVPITDIDEDYLDLFIRKRIRDMSLTSKSYSGMRLLLMGTFKYAKRQKYTTINIATFFENIDLSPKIFHKSERKPQVFTNEEVERLSAHIKDLPVSSLNLLIMFGFFTGLRAGELVSLSPKDIDLEERVVHVYKTEIKFKGEDGKTTYEIRETPKTEAGIRDVYLCDQAVELYKEMRRLNPFGEFLAMHDGMGYHTRNLTIRLYKLCDDIEIPRRSMHKARKTYATKLINSGVDESLIKDQMGHTDIRTTKSHYFFDNTTSEEGLKQIQKAINF